MPRDYKHRVKSGRKSKKRTPRKKKQQFPGWVWFLGGWFFAGVIGVIAGSLYMKYDNAMMPSVFMIIMILLLNSVFFAQPDNDLPSAEGFVYIIGILVSVVVGMMIYEMFIKE